jgi:hypothetical protein
VTEKSDDAAPIPGARQVSEVSSVRETDPAESTASAAVDQAQDDRAANSSGPRLEQPQGEHGGPRGPEPTRYGDWEKGGRCFDF